MSPGEVRVAPKLRWGNYVMGREGSPSGYTAEALIAAAGRESTDGSLYVLGLGFDPRTLYGLRQVLDKLPRPIKVLALSLGPSKSVGRTRSMQAAHTDTLAELCRDAGAELVLHPYPEPMEDRRRAGIRIARDLASAGTWNAGHIVIDISALPSTVFFALVRSVLGLPRPDSGRQLQLLVTENPDLDDRIRREGVQSPIPVPGYDGDGKVDLAAEPTGPRVWAPVLGKGQDEQMRAIAATLKPDEVCPVLPFPARNPRRGDDLLVEHHSLLFEVLGAEPRNFIYADERNPFDLYRTLSELQFRYRDVLSPLGNAVVVPSTHSSKLLAVGVMLAAIEQNLSVMNAGPEGVGFDIDPNSRDLEVILTSNELTCLWLDGLPYDY